MEGTTKISPCKDALGFCTSVLKRADFFFARRNKDQAKSLFY